MFGIKNVLATFISIAAVGLIGCTNQAETSTSTPPDPHVGHAHAAEGPHHGRLIELGNESYHAELVHDDLSVTIYVLNGSADQQVPIEATEVTINTNHDGPKQFSLAASPDENDPAGKSSRFVSTDTELIANVDAEGATPKLVLTIEGKSYRGQLAHDHDH